MTCKDEARRAITDPGGDFPRASFGQDVGRLGLDAYQIVGQHKSDDITTGPPRCRRVGPHFRTVSLSVYMSQPFECLKGMEDQLADRLVKHPPDSLTDRF